ncbi:uncharacterized protein A4U43_C07F2370 [Asparagus officinalis]|uniref:Symplekin C-terminal domain-containing protein n=1 Tax=Asparagus officinalis TaxID=4686 RepID=A0A5P1EBW8_ASPOF|nr:uncharacterized protein A4U43_C07F2370 [Asparagus officinalis]
MEIHDTSKALEVLKEIGSRPTEGSSLLMPNLLACLKHDDPVVVRQSVTIGTSLFCTVLTEMVLQLRDSNKVEGWLEEMWSWMLRFKDAVRSLLLELDSPQLKVLAAKFLETCFLLFTSDGNDGEEGQDHPVLGPNMLAKEAGEVLNLFYELLQSASTLSGSLVTTIINCLASIAIKRPGHYDSILSVLLEFDPNFETSRDGQASSIQYAVRIALLRFLRCTHPCMFESRDKLVRVARGRYPGDTTELFIRQMEKLSRGIESNIRDARLSKVDPLPSHSSAPANHLRTRPVIDPADSSAVSDEMPSMRSQPNASEAPTLPVKVSCDMQNANEGEKGAQSLELLLSQIHPDLLADMVIETMKNLPKDFSALPEGNISMPLNSETSLPSVSSQGWPTVSSAASGQSSALPSVFAPAVVGSNGIISPPSDIPSVPNIVNDIKRDPRRDPRRLDPRRAEVPAGSGTIPMNSKGIDGMQGLIVSLSKPTPLEAPVVDDAPVSLMSKNELEAPECLTGQATEQQITEENLDITYGSAERDPSLEGQMPTDLPLSPVYSADQELITSIETVEDESVDGNTLESNEYSSCTSARLSSGDGSHDFPAVPDYIELSDEQKMKLSKLAITRLAEDYKSIQASGCDQPHLSILARLVAQIDADKDLVTFFQKHIILDYHHNKGHDLAMHVLYHLHAVTVSELEDHSSLETHNYEKFLLAIAKTLLDSLPASDKSFSRLLGEAPSLTKSAFILLEDLCQLHGYENHTIDTSDGDRITQGLGALWGLILGRPLYRQICLDIALKCSVHSHDEVRTKAIRLVANKLFLLPYAAESIEKFAKDMLFSVVDQQVTEAETKDLASSEQMTETGRQETSINGSHYSELGPESGPGIQLSPHSIQRQTSLFFALCTKKPSLLRLVFDVYGRASKVVKQSIHRHVPGLVRNLGPSYPELLQIVADPPEGSENLITLLLQLMTEESTPSADLIASVKHLYDTKLKDVSILIPMLSSLSKDEVLPIFPQLVDLPLEKFQAALDRILQGSAHTGPALTPVEVLVAIHDIDPVKHGVALKKITDACTACFEQRTVFTQHVLAKFLSHMVERDHLPMLFMRTVIQAIGTYPALVDFVMGILSKLVNKQIWKMPKLWVGFLKLVSQTHPHSFNVLLQLPPPQLMTALNKHANLRGPLAAYANQPNIRTSLSRQTLQVLGLNEPQHASTMPFTSSVHGSTLS